MQPWGSLVQLLHAGLRCRLCDLVRSGAGLHRKRRLNLLAIQIQSFELAHLPKSGAVRCLLNISLTITLQSSAPFSDDLLQTLPL